MITVSRYAFLDMFLSCLNHDGEWGGVTFGRNHQEILFAVPSGDFASSTKLGYIQNLKDVDYLQKKISEIESCFPEVFLNGFFHSHPPGICGLSCTDLCEAKKVLTDPFYRHGGKLLMPLFERHEMGFRVWYYIVSLARDEVEVLRDAAIVVPSDIPLEVYA